MNGFIRVFDISRHQPKSLLLPRSGYDLFGNFGEIIMAKCNATASHMALTIATESLIPDGKLYIWDMDRDKLAAYDFMNRKSANDEEVKSSDIILGYSRYIIHRQDMR